MARPPPPPAGGRPPKSATFDRIAGLFAPPPAPFPAESESRTSASGVYERPPRSESARLQAEEAERQRGRELALRVAGELDHPSAGPRAGTSHQQPSQQDRHHPAGSSYERGGPSAGRGGRGGNASSTAGHPRSFAREAAQSRVYPGYDPAPGSGSGSFARRSRSPQPASRGPTAQGPGRRERSPPRHLRPPQDPYAPASSSSYPPVHAESSYNAHPPPHPGNIYPPPQPHPQYGHSQPAPTSSYPPGAYPSGHGNVGPPYGGMPSDSRTVFDAFGRPFPVAAPSWQPPPDPASWNRPQHPHPQPGFTGFAHPPPPSMPYPPPPPASYERPPPLAGVAYRPGYGVPLPSDPLSSHRQDILPPRPPVGLVPDAVGGAAKRGSDRDEQPMPKRPKLDFQPAPRQKKATKAKPVAPLPPAEPLKSKPHRPASAVPPEFDKELAPNLLLNYVVSLHRPHVRKRHPAALYDYQPLVEKPDGERLVPEDLVKCTITLPDESPVPAEFKVGRGEGTKPEGKQEAAKELVLNLWRCGELDDDYAPIMDEEELARQTNASSCLGITPYRTKVPDLWSECIACKDLVLYPTLLVFPAVPVRPSPAAALPLPVPTTSAESPAAASLPPTESTPPPIEYTTPRPLLMFTRRPLPPVKPGINLYFQDELSTVTLTIFEAMSVSQADIDRVKAYSLTLVRAIVNRPMIYMNNPDGSPGEGPWYVCPVDMAWYETYQQKQAQETVTPGADVAADQTETKGKRKGKKAKEASRKRKQMEEDPAAEREMVDWAEMDACRETTFEAWQFEDADALERQSVDAMVTGKAEFSRRMEVLRIRKDLSPHSMPADSPREAGSASLLEYVKSTTSTFTGLRNEHQALLEMRKIPGVLGHVRKQAEVPTVPSLNKVHEQKYMIPELAQRSTLTASTFMSSLYLPSLMNRLEQVLLTKELNATLFKGLFEDRYLSQALAAPSTGGENDYERFEYIGDSALKLLATTYLFVSRPSDNEHLLHDGRKQIIANGSLTQHAVESGLPPYIHARDFSIKTWYPHNIAVARPAIMPTDREIKFQDIGDKTKADVTESIIGAAYDQGGLETAWKACKMLSIRVPYIETWGQMAKKVKTPQSKAPFADSLRANLGTIQEILKYKFKNEALLCHALTATSANHSIFQRMQFYGDAVIDLLSVKYASTKFPALGPGALTHLKSAMINNHTTASLCVALNLHHYAVFEGGVLPRSAAEYIPKITAAREKEEETARAESREPGQYWAEIDAPKILADVVEAILAAIMIDSGFQFESVEAFFTNVQRPWMDQYIRGLGSLTGHPSKLLTEILQARRCQNFEIIKSLTTGARPPALNKTEVMLHGHCLGWAVEVTPNFSSRRASEFALNAIEGTPDLMDRLCDCPGGGGGGGGGGTGGKKVKVHV